MTYTWNAIIFYGMGKVVFLIILATLIIYIFSINMEDSMTACFFFINEHLERIWRYPPFIFEKRLLFNYPVRERMHSLEEHIAYRPSGDIFFSHAHKTLFDCNWLCSNIVSSAHHHFLGIFNVFFYTTPKAVSLIYLNSLHRGVAFTQRKTQHQLKY